MFYFRCGWEMQPLPGTNLVSFAKSSPPFDQRAISSYFAISRELKDAYPADYNDLGKILEVIKSAARVALPVASMIFPAARPVLAGISGLLGASDKPKSRDSALGVTEQTPDLMSAVTREKLQRQTAATPIAQRVRLTRPLKVKMKAKVQRRRR